jgi:hypothetical protein
MVGQERLADARALLDGHAATGGRMQRAWMDAYLAIRALELDQARALAEAWQEHPPLRWSQRFQALLAELDEGAGAAPRVVDDAIPDQVNRMDADSEPSLDLAWDGQRLWLDHQGVDAIELGFPPLDLQLLFSIDPFEVLEDPVAPLAAPVEAQVFALEAGVDRTELRLPEAWRTRPALLTARAGGRLVTVLSGADRLALQPRPRAGLIRVRSRDGGEVLPKTYVKVYGRQNGTSRFLKDGYTDHRGWFDYASASGSFGERYDRLAIFISHPEHGSSVLQLAPPDGR